MKKQLLFLAAAIVMSGTANAQTGIGTTTPGSTLTVNGSFAAQYNNVTTTPYTMAETDFYVVYNGSANGAFSLPASVSGSGNFKGRLYTIKNTTASYSLSITPNGSETIDGGTSISLAAGQSVQLVNTGLTGANATWEIVSYNTATSSGGCTPDNITATLSATQNGVGSGTDITFSSTLGTAQGITNTSGVFALTAGKTYMLRSQLHTNNYSNTANGSLTLQWVSASSNTPLAGATSGVVFPVTQSGSGSPGGTPEAFCIYKPATNENVKVRITASSGTASVYSYSFASIIQLNACGAGGSGGGSVSASNGLTSTGGVISLGGTLTAATNIDNGGNNLTITGAGNTGIGNAAPGSKLDVGGSFAAQYNRVTTTPYTLTANDYYLAYNGTAAGTINLPASVSGTGNFKGRLYTIKNATSSYNLTVAANGSEAIDGNASLTLSPGQSIQLVNTGLTGAANTWEIVSYTAANNTAGCTPDNITATLAAGQTFVNAPVDVNFSQVLGTSQGFTAPSSGVFTLTAGKTYILRAQILMSTNAEAAISYTWVNSSTNAQLTGASTAYAVQGGSNSVGATEAYCIYRPTTNESVKVRVLTRTGSSTSNTISNAYSFASIIQLNACGGSTSIATVNGTNGLTSTGSAIGLGGTLTGATTIANGGNNLTITGTGNLGVGNASPTAKLDVTGSAKVSGDLSVQNGMGIIRNSSATQLMMQTVNVNAAFALGGDGTNQVNFTWPAAFSATPIAYVGNFSTGSGGFGECSWTLVNVTATGGRLIVHNTLPGTNNTTGTVNIVGIGAQ